MRKIDFKSSDRGKFVGELREKAQARSDGGLVFSHTKLKTPGVNLLAFNSDTNKGEHQDIMYIAAYSNDMRFEKEDIKDGYQQAVLNILEVNFGLRVSNILGYCIEGGSQERPIEGYAHRALNVGTSLRQMNGAQFLHNTMNKLRGEWRKEITYVPSLLYFYLKQGFCIESIHIPVGHSETYTQYDLDENQKNIIKQLIIWCLKKGDISLPFFVELRDNDSQKVQDIQTSYDIIPGDLISSMEDFILDYGRSKERIGVVHSRGTQRFLEEQLGLDIKNLSRTEKFRSFLKI